MYKSPEKHADPISPNTRLVEVDSSGMACGVTSIVFPPHLQEAHKGVSVQSTAIREALRGSLYGRFGEWLAHQSEHTQCNHQASLTQTHDM